MVICRRHPSTYPVAKNLCTQLASVPIARKLAVYCHGRLDVSLRRSVVGLARAGCAGITGVADHQSTTSMFRMLHGYWLGSCARAPLVWAELRGHLKIRFRE